MSGSCLHRGRLDRIIAQLLSFLSWALRVSTDYPPETAPPCAINDNLNRSKFPTLQSVTVYKIKFPIRSR